MTRPSDDAVRSGIAGTLEMLELVSQVASVPGSEFALPVAREFVESLDEPAVRRLAALLAVEAVWRMPLPPVEPRTAGDMDARGLELRRWCWGRRRDVVRARKALRQRDDARGRS